MKTYKPTKMLTPKETADKLIEYYFPFVNAGEPYQIVLSKAKKSSLKSVNLVLSTEIPEETIKFFQEVSKEIEAR